MTDIKPFPPALAQAYHAWKKNSFPAQEGAFTTVSYTHLTLPTIA